MSGKIIVGNGTPVMIVLPLIERIIDAEVLVEVAHMVGYDVNHNPNISGVTGANKVDEILFRSKVAVQLVKVSTPISVISTVAVVDDGRDPNGVKTHALNVVEVVNDTFVTTSTVVT